MQDTAFIGWTVLMLTVLASIYIGRRRAEPEDLEPGRFVVVKEKGSKSFRAMVVRTVGDTVVVRRICTDCQNMPTETTMVLEKDVRPL